jgi:hypothetical protein
MVIHASKKVNGKNERLKNEFRFSFEFPAVSLPERSVDPENRGCSEAEIPPTGAARDELK